MSTPWKTLELLYTIEGLELAEPAFVPGFERPTETTARQVGATHAHRLPDLGVTGKGVVIADLDSGFDLLHPAFFKADGSVWEWVDLDGDGMFSGDGTDAVDYDGCLEDNDCRVNEGYVCDTSRIYVPGGDPNQGTLGRGDAGAPCMEDADCGPLTMPYAREGQIPSYPGSYCLTAVGCTTGSCGGDNLCVRFAEESNFRACIDGCVEDADCREPDYSCKQFGQDKACLPK